MFYPLTSKLDTPAQLAKHERRCRVLRRIAEAGDMPPSGSHDYHSPADASPSTSSGQHHRIATTQASPINLYTFLRGNNGDPAVKVGVTSQREHTLHVSHFWFSEFYTKTKGSRPFQASEARR